MSRAPDRLLSARTAVEAAVTAVVATLTALIVFGPIWSRMTSPLGAGDMLPTYVNADNWTGLSYATTTHYGFPLGMNLNYSPNLDLTENAFARMVNVVFGSPFLGINLLLFLSFPVVAVLAYALLRMVSRGGPVAIALAVAFSMIPYHFGRGLGHTYLATLYGGVAAVILAFVIGMGYLPGVLRSPNGRPRASGWVLLSGLVVLVAWSGLYYAAFGIILGLAAVVWRIARGDAWRRIGKATAPVAAVAALALVGFLPALVTVLGDPPTSPLSERSAAESVNLAGSLSMALIPAPISEVRGLGRYNDAVISAVGEASGQSTFENTVLTNYGTWITTACALLFVVGWVVLARRRRTKATAIPFIGYLLAVTILFFVPWGLNFVVANLVTAQVRAWNRLLPVLLLLFVAGAMAVLARMRADRTGPVSIGAGLVILLAVVVTQVIPFRVPYEQGASTGTLSADRAREYARQTNTAIPEHCGILQLPYVQYPEQGVLPPDLNDYEHFMHPLLNEGKDFSYGAVKNTAASAQLAGIRQVPTSAEIDLLRSQGFCAIHVDVRGVPDNVWTFMKLDLEGAFGPPVATGNDGAWQLFDIRSQ